MPASTIYSEADAPLSAEIVTAQQRYDIAHGKGPLHGHYLRTLFRKRGYED